MIWEAEFDYFLKALLNLPKKMTRYLGLCKILKEKIKDFAAINANISSLLDTVLAHFYIAFSANGVPYYNDRRNKIAWGSF